VPKAFVDKAKRILVKSEAEASRLGSTAEQWIANHCKGGIYREFPGEFRNSTIREIDELAKQGNRAAQKAKKLLTDKRFRKGVASTGSESGSARLSSKGVLGGFIVGGIAGSIIGGLLGPKE
jgi:hypothetical protein